MIFAGLVLGFVLGFIGYLPLGNINLTVVQMSLTETAKSLWTYILFVAAMEFLYCVACIGAADLLMQQPDWIIRLKWLGVIIFALLGFSSLLKVEHPERTTGNIHIRKGILIAIVNPFQVPFWLIWSVYLTQNKFLRKEAFYIALFGMVTAAGTAAVLWLYAIGGKNVVERLGLSRTFMNRFIGVILLGLAAWQMAKLLHPANFI
jgi:threonine/homoserine/homoserine lactone efflux protein